MDAASVVALIGLVPAFAAASFAYLQARSAEEDAHAAERRSRAAEDAADAANEQAAQARRTADATQESVRAAREATRAQAIMELEDQLARHAEVHTALSDGKWLSPGEHPTRAKLAPVEAYMGLFERLDALVDAGVLDPGFVEESYGYRIPLLRCDRPAWKSGSVAGERRAAGGIEQQLGHDPSSGV